MMSMKQVASVTVPANGSVELAPGGYHVMLLDLKRQLQAGDTVPVTLVVEGKDGKTESIELMAPVKPLGGGGMQHHKH